MGGAMKTGVLRALAMFASITGVAGLGAQAPQAAAKIEILGVALDTAITDSHFGEGARPAEPSSAKMVVLTVRLPRGPSFKTTQLVLDFSAGRAMGKAECDGYAPVQGRWLFVRKDKGMSSLDFTAMGEGTIDLRLLFTVPKGVTKARFLVKGVPVGEPVDIPSAPSAAAGKVLKAELWPYKSLCDFKEAPNWPTKQSFMAGLSLKDEGCRDLEGKLGQPRAVRLMFENSSVADWEIPLAGLASVTVKSGGKPLAALAVRRKSEYGIAFTTEITGTWVVHVRPSQKVDLVVLFPAAQRGDAVSIAGVASVKIE